MSSFSFITLEVEVYGITFLTLHRIFAIWKRNFIKRSDLSFGNFSWQLFVSFQKFFHPSFAGCKSWQWFRLLNKLSGFPANLSLCNFHSFAQYFVNPVNKFDLHLRVSRSSSLFDLHLLNFCQSGIFSSDLLLSCFLNRLVFTFFASFCDGYFFLLAFWAHFRQIWADFNFRSFSSINFKWLIFFEKGVFLKLTPCEHSSLWSK